MKNIVFVILILMLTSCCDALHPEYQATGYISCYSYGEIIYHGKYYGAITRGSNSEWSFTEYSTNNKVKLTGECVVSEYKK